jgi:hypothetical protein
METHQDFNGSSFSLWESLGASSSRAEARHTSRYEKATNTYRLIYAFMSNGYDQPLGDNGWMCRFRLQRHSLSESTMVRFRRDKTKSRIYAHSKCRSETSITSRRRLSPRIPVTPKLNHQRALLTIITTSVRKGAAWFATYSLFECQSIFVAGVVVGRLRTPCIVRTTTVPPTWARRDTSANGRN